MEAVDRQRALYNGAPQVKELQKCVQDHVNDKRSGLQRIHKSSHQVVAGKCAAQHCFFGQCPLGVKALDLQVQHSTKEEDAWEDCHDAGLLAWGVGLWGHPAWHAVF